MPPGSTPTLPLEAGADSRRIQSANQEAHPLSHLMPPAASGRRVGVLPEGHSGIFRARHQPQMEEWVCFLGALGLPQVPAPASDGRVGVLPGCTEDSSSFSTSLKLKSACASLVHSELPRLQRQPQVEKKGWLCVLGAFKDCFGFSTSL